MPLAEIRRHPQNKRRGNVERIVESIRLNGWFGAVGCQRSSGYLVWGNHRTDAAEVARDRIERARSDTWDDGEPEIVAAWRAWPERFGTLDELPVFDIDCDDDEALNILIWDNTTSDEAEWDRPGLGQLLSDISTSRGSLDDLPFARPEIDELLAEFRAQELGDRGRDPDAVPEPPAEPVTRPGDLWLLGPHRLYCGDATEAESLELVLEGEQVPLVFTSFPYALGVDYGETYVDDIAHLRALLAVMPQRLVEIVTAGGFVVTNFGDIVAASGLLGTGEPCEYPMALEYWEPFRSAGFVLHTRRAWAKPNARVYAPWTASSNRSAADWEHLWTWKSPGRGLNERRDMSPLGVWDTSRMEGVAIGKDRFPAAFPTGLATLVLDVYSNAADAVLDPFAGTGTTIIAAEQRSRRGRAIEIWPAACDQTCQRFQDFTGTKPILERTGEPHDFTEITP